MKYIDLFNEIQLKRDYYEDPVTGANWRYTVNDDEKRVFVEVQETKTLKDWMYNFNVIPVKVEDNYGRTITVPMGMRCQAEVVIQDILDHVNGVKTDKHLPTDYEWFFTGWSLGGMVAGIAGFALNGKLGVKQHYIGYGTPAFLWGKKSLATFVGTFESVKNFLYNDDWIKSLIPLYKRPDYEDVKPVNPDNPQTLDQRHRVYGHCKYLHEEF